MVRGVIVSVCQVPGYNDVRYQCQCVRYQVTRSVCVSSTRLLSVCVCVCQVPGYGDVKVSVESVPQCVVIGSTFTVNLKVINCSWVTLQCLVMSDFNTYILLLCFHPLWNQTFVPVAATPLPSFICQSHFMLLILTSIPVQFLSSYIVYSVGSWAMEPMRQGGLCLLRILDPEACCGACWATPCSSVPP